MVSIHENRAPLASLFLWVGAFLLTLFLSPYIPSGIPITFYHLVVLGVALVALPLYLMVKWNVGEAAIFLGFSLVFWSAGDFICVFTPGQWTGSYAGTCYLLRRWYPPSFLILLRLFAGAILIVYLVLNPEVGAEPAALRGLGRQELFWVIRATLIAAVLLGVGWMVYGSISRASFGGDVLYILSGDYRSLQQPELIYKGVLVVVEAQPSGYVLVRRSFNLTDLQIGRISGVRWDTTVLDRYLGLEVEVLGKLSEIRPDSPEERYLYPGRIRLAVV